MTTWVVEYEDEHGKEDSLTLTGSEWNNERVFQYLWNELKRETIISVEQVS